MTRYTILSGDRVLHVHSGFTLEAGQWVKPFRDEWWHQIDHVTPARSQRVMIGDGIVDEEPREEPPDRKKKK